jgi:hypothetical protein
MRQTRNSGRVRLAASLALGAVGILLSGCGGEDFQNEPRPPVSVELTGVIQDKGITISPDRVGAGPIEITISNQTKAAHTITLEGEPAGGNRVRERVGPVNPLDTATVQKTLRPGTYEVRAGSERAVPREIAPATLTVGRERRDTNSQLLQPNPG